MREVGTITHASEISLVDDVPGAASDLAGLWIFDSDGDGQLSAPDRLFAYFGVWHEAHVDEKVDWGAGVSLSAADIASIAWKWTVHGETTGFDKAPGLDKGSYTLADGGIHAFADSELTDFVAAEGSQENGGAIPFDRLDALDMLSKVARDDDDPLDLNFEKAFAPTGDDTAQMLARLDIGSLQWQGGPAYEIVTAF